LVEAGPGEHGSHVQGRDIPAGNRQKTFLSPGLQLLARFESDEHRLFKFIVHLVQSDFPHISKSLLAN
jgi:hypothetical protein